VIPAALDRAIWERDRGVCKKCGIDLDAVRALLDGYYAAALVETHHDANRAMAITRCYAQAMYPGNADAYPHRLWQRNHVISVAEGGETVLENMETLCTICHKGETKKLAKRLGLHRRRHSYRPHFPEEIR
jgi:5-methylcytosine-specific restriction endonuclease McrA